jgi:hypothetical protein
MMIEGIYDAARSARSGAMMSMAPRSAAMAVGCVDACRARLRRGNGYFLGPGGGVDFSGAENSG